MKIFISWSGPHSLAVAKALREALPILFNDIELFVSSESIRKGERGLPELSKELDEGNFGIACLTSDNLEAPWLNFESGALSKHAKDSCLWTLLLGGLRIGDIEGPLSQFQHTEFEKEEVFKLIKSINHAHGEAKQDEARLRTIFDKFWWTDLERKVTDASRLAKTGFELFAGSTYITNGCTIDLRETGTLALRILNLSRATAEWLCISFCGRYMPSTWSNEGLMAIPVDFMLKPSNVDAEGWYWLPEQVNQIENRSIVTENRWLWRTNQIVTSGVTCSPEPIRVLANFPYSSIRAHIGVEVAGVKPQWYNVTLLLNPEGRATPTVTAE